MAHAVVLILSALVLSCSGQLLDDFEVFEKECIGEEVFQCMNGGCVSEEKYCDGTPDCPDGSDEDFCPNHLPDPKLCNLTHHYLCADLKKCIPNSWICNNETDCDDGSDETNCTVLPDKPGKNSTCIGFLCDGSRCISKLWVCDGYYDCEDKSDEYSEDTCRHATLSHSLHEMSTCQELSNTGERHYRCIDSSFCLPEVLMCDGLADCRDGSDEGIFCREWKTMCKEKSPCVGNHTKCYPERYGPSCVCSQSPAMRRYNYKTNLCEDIDECTQARPQCSHLCENKDGHFVCHCDVGYNLDVYGYLCYADGPEAMLFFTTRTDIRYVKIKSKQEVVVATGIKQAHGVSYDGKYLYWVETAEGHQAIMRAQFDDVQKTKEVLVSLGLEDPGDIAVDWVGGHLYFSDVHRGTISVCRTDGSMCTTLHTNAKQPRFVTLAARYGQMYWADWHHRPVIMAANMDGSQPRVLVDTLITFATGLAVDLPNGRLYYVDETIKIMKIDDKQTYSLFEEPFHHPYSLAVFENTVFWSDWTSNTIQTTDKLHGTTQKRFMLIASGTPVYDMHVYHPVLFDNIHNPCENKTCSHMCLLATNTTAVCACPDGMSLHGDTCEHVDGYRPLYLVVGGGSSFTRIDYNSLGNPESHTTHFDIGRVQAMAYDNTRDTLYMYDGQRKLINFINMTDFTLGITHLFLYKGLVNIVDMDYDYATDSLYLLDAGRRFIEVVSLKTQQRALLFRFKDEEIPISLCVMPDYGRMLVAVMENEHGNIHIDSIGLDGEDRQHIVTNDLQGPRIRLRYDQNMDVVYISDEGNSVIDLMHPEGTGRENFRQLTTTITSMAVTDTYVFWTDRRTRLYWSSVHEASHYIRRIEFSIFPDNTQLHIQATSPPPDTKNPLLNHPCVTSHPCSHVCVQTSHAPLSIIHKSRTNSSNTYKCLCPPSLLLLDGQCTQLARCKENELYCHRSNACFSRGSFCDGVKDCTHGEDEEGCELRPSYEKDGCPSGNFLCNNICIDKSQSCSTGESTTSTTTTPAPPTCSSAEFKCRNSSICIERSQMCDGQVDCLNGSDEAPALCDVLACQSNEFMCTLGSCILESFRCDGDDDCADGSDEVNCDSKSCGLGYYQCRNKECIELRKRCDGQQDCVDLSDEEECEEPVIEAMEEPIPPCAEYTCALNRSICLPLTARCNTKTDCPGGTDETGCDLRCAPHGLFECKQEYLCVSLHRICDGHKDCRDGSDETPEACGKMNKTSRLYPPAPLYPAGECSEGFLCGSGQCLEWRQVCDGYADCVDNSDEDGFCETACQNNTCAFSCQATPTGAHCMCPLGLKTGDQNSCIDVDECAQETLCSQVCHNVPGSFLCSCHHGYALRADRRSCKATKGDLAVLYVSGNTVWSIAADGKGSVLYNDPKNAAIADMDVDVRRNKLFVSLTEAGKLLEVNSTSTDVEVTNIGQPTKLAVDWITGVVYFVDATPGAKCIRACNVLKKRCAKLHKLPINAEVTSLIVDPPSARMFYCARRSSDSIVFSASLAGGELADVATARNCSGLAVDSFKKLLYVAEADEKRIVRMDFNGENQETVLSEQTHLQAPHGLALFEDSIYFLITNSFKLNRCSLFGKKHCEPVIYRVLGADTFVLRHESVQRNDLRDLCEGFVCSNLCVRGAAGPRCLCDDGAPAAEGACRLLEKEQLPLFNGWTYEEYRRAHHVSFTIIAAVLALLAVYLAVFIYYHFVRPKRRTQPPPYMEVRFQNTTDGEGAGPTTTVIELSDSSASRHEFVNPLEYVRDLWDQVRRQNRPVGTSGLDISVPYAQDLSDTESDLDERETRSIIRKDRG